MLPKPKTSTKRILYLTDKFGVSQGYSKSFSLMLANCGIKRKQVIETNIYGLVNKPLIKKGNRKAWGFNPERKDEIEAAFNQRIETVAPDIIVCSCPAILGFLCDWDWDLATLDKCRGGVYYYRGIPVIVTYPITAIHQQVDQRLLKDADGDDIAYEPYRVKQGAWILARDWEKVGRFNLGVQIRLPEFEYSVVRSIEDAKAAEEFLGNCKLIGVDIETGCYPAQITCCGFTGITVDGRCRSFVFPYYDPFSTQVKGCFWEDESDHEIVWSIMCRILDNDVLKTMQNGFYDSSYFIKYRTGCRNYQLDSMYLWYSLYMELPKTLDFISSILLDNFQYWKDDIKGLDQDNIAGKEGMETYWRYNALDCYYTLFNTMRLMVVFEQSEMMRNNYKDTWMRMVSGLQLSMRGMRADFKRMDEHRIALIEDASRRKSRFRYLIADPTFNINSPVQKCQLFYDVLGARERNKSGRYVTNKKGDNRSSGKIPLKMIKTEHPYFKFLVDALEDSMEPDKQLSNVFGRRDPETGYVKGGIKFFSKRFRSAFNAAGTTTTRFSSKSSNFWDGTNAQNIREIYRDWLVADDGCILFDVDFSQSDDVFMGYEANDAAKIKVIESGVDGHAVHGELFFKVPYDEIVSGKKADDPWIVHPITGVRQISKRVVHGTNFQMAGVTLYMTMGRDAVVTAAKLLGFKDADSWTQERLVNVCVYMMSQYRKKYPRLTKNEYYKEIATALKTKGTLTNAFGIERRFIGDPADNGTQREATGFIGQSDTAGNMNRTMYEIDHGYIPERFRDGQNPSWRARPLQMNWQSHGFMFLLQIHDSFVGQLNLRHPNWKEAIHNLLTVMERPIIINGHSVSIRTECAIGKRWNKKSMVEWKSKDVHDLDRLIAS